MPTNSPPSRNPAEDDSMVGMMRLVLTKFLQNTDDMLPAQVMAYDRATNLAQVQPLIAMVTTDNIVIRRAQVAAVPVVQLGGGGFVLSFPIATGDLGWIKANDRDISLFKATFASSSPNTQRKHSFEDAVFIPDTMMRGVTVAPEDAANAVFQNLAGTVKIALWDDLIQILAPSGVGIGGTPGPGALLDLQGAKAFGLPQMTTAQKNAIPSPRKGFQVFDTDLDGVSTYTSAGWT
ncbi:Gp138 family membrane-puncturing spike protein [Singulisphaera sp. PoT]|uniref:Gp138 family membrane-puncturing spike protein n=1 Tax=Singulisphaera sp. PoT TaxID=3411797 RepID=UPI003BF57F2C